MIRNQYTPEQELEVAKIIRDSYIRLENIEFGFAVFFGVMAWIVSNFAVEPITTLFCAGASFACMWNYRKAAKSKRQWQGAVDALSSDVEG